MDIPIACEQSAYSSLLMRSRAGQADPEPMLARLVRGGFALACILPARATIRHQPLQPCILDEDAVVWTYRLHASN